AAALVAGVAILPQKGYAVWFGGKGMALALQWNSRLVDTLSWVITASRYSIKYDTMKVLY
uniref:hypothetical protein n=1 Tax=uncultured Adlercreutzia sp. TaxID=875803 RepID=UPI0026F3DB99